MLTYSQRSVLNIQVVGKKKDWLAKALFQVNDKNFYLIPFTCTIQPPVQFVTCNNIKFTAWQENSSSLQNLQVRQLIVVYYTVFQLYQFMQYSYINFKQIRLQGQVNSLLVKSYFADEKAKQFSI